MAKIGRPISWPIPKTPISSRLQEILPQEGLARIALKYFGGISKETAYKYLSGDSEPSVSQILELCKKGQVNPLYVIFGLGHYSDEVYGLDDPELLKPEPQGGLRISSTDLSAVIPRRSAIATHTVTGSGDSRYEPIPFTLEPKGVPVVGKAAADETQGAIAGFFPPDPEAYFDELTIPETTAAVEIIGDSMSPVLLGGQYAIVGPEYMLPYSRPRDYDIVVVSVDSDSIYDDDSAIDARWDGVFCKRIVDAGDTWLFLSINATGTPFTVMKKHCRLWPVIGVWFAGKGRPPED